MRRMKPDLNRPDRAAKKKHAIDSAVSVAQDITTGKLDPDHLEAQAAAECRALFGTVIGPDDPLWELHVDVARQVLALDGVSAEELEEWVAVYRSREGASTPADTPG